MDDVTVSVETEVNLTEAEEKVKVSLANVFGSFSIISEPSSMGSLLVAEVKGREALDNFRNLLRRNRIRNAARKVFFAGLRGNTISFFLNKQVAFAGHISFAQETGESPLGPIKVVIECENPRDLIDWLTQGAP
jgi:predicted RNA binding protein with dsRBD fold (UPF0201 family)